VAGVLVPALSFWCPPPAAQANTLLKTETPNTNKIAIAAFFISSLL
jgi:hypothetical protein